MRSEIKAWMDRAKAGLKEANTFRYLANQRDKPLEVWSMLSSKWIDPAKRKVKPIIQRLRVWHVALFAFLILALLLWAYGAEIWALLSPAGWNIEKHFGDAEHISNLRNLGLVLLGVVGLPLAIWRSTVAQQQIFVMQKGQYADRFAKAAAMLADDSLPVREAGIFALRELAMADPKGHYFPVQDLLCSFMRDASSKAEEQETEKSKSSLTLVPNHTPEDDDPPPCTSDVIAALRAFSDLRTPKNKRREEERGWEPDLQKAKLTKFPGHSRKIDLSKANLQWAQLQEADLTSAQLQEADFSWAQLQGANLSEAQLQGATLFSSELQGAKLKEARLQGADLTWANLQRACLAGAKLQKAVLTAAKLQEAALAAAKLQGADLAQAKLQGANLMWTHLQGANLMRADLTGTDLTWTDLEQAKFSLPIWAESEWPKNWAPSEAKKGETAPRELIDYFVFLPADEEDET